MSSTRSVIAPPPFAANALTVIPPTPVAGVSYRDEAAGPASSPDGWPYAERVNSAEWNQIMYQLSSLMAILDTQGILGWSSLANYTSFGFQLGSDGNMYKWLLPSGPANGGAKDPLTNPTYWRLIDNDLELTGQVAYFATATPPTGWVERNGAAISRTANAKLFAKIGTTYGVGDGSTTFNVPDSRGLFDRALDQGKGIDPSRVLGSTQKASVHSFDIGTGVGLVGDRSGITPINGTNARLDLGYDPVSAGAYPSGASASLSIGAQPSILVSPLTDSAEIAFGGVRPGNQAFLACIKL